MRPSSKQLIAGIRWSFDTFVLPDLDSRLGQSAGRSIQVLLDHLRERIETEGPMLTEDNLDMRTLFGELIVSLRPVALAGGELHAALNEAQQQLDREFRPSGSFPDNESLTLENEALKRTLVRLINAVLGGRNQLPEAVFQAADSRMRAQLRRQLDREHRWIQPVIGRRPY